MAESCTGGLLAHLLTNVAGSSNYFIGGVVAYSPAAKIKLLKVKKEVIDTKGIVSKDVALAMAKGVRALLDTDLGVGITGFAGPTGGEGSANAPVGTVCIGLYSLCGETTREFFFTGSREEIKAKAAQSALELIKEFVLKNPLLR